METVLSLGQGTTKSFWEAEYHQVNLMDKRLKRRALIILHALQERLTSCVRRLFTNRLDMRQAYDFFSNPKITGSALLAPHYARTVQRLKKVEADYIIAIQDSTYLNYTPHKAKQELGRIGASRDRSLQGLIQHSTLCVTPANECLGLLDVHYFHHDERNTQIPSHSRDLAQRQSYCWIQAVKAMQARLGEHTTPVITVADREGDFFDFLKTLQVDHQPFVIGAKYDRYIGQTYRQREDKLFARLTREHPIGRMAVQICDPTTHIEHTLTLALKRAKAIFLPPVYRGRGSIKPDDQPIQVNAVMAYDDTYRWVLLTSLPVDTLEQVQCVINIYRCRWHIESFHKVLKTAYQVEQLYLHASRQAIENALSLITLSACRFYWLVFAGRQAKTTSAAQVFESFEWHALYCYFNEPPPLHVPTLSDVINRIACLGGYKQRKHDKPPGIKTLWYGFQLFTAITRLYQIKLHLDTLYKRINCVCARNFGQELGGYKKRACLKIASKVCFY